MVAFADLDGDYKNKNFIQTQTIPRWMRGLLFVMKPFTALFSAFQLIRWPTDKNCLKAK